MWLESIDRVYVNKHSPAAVIVREKAKNMVALLKDETRLTEERKRAMQAKERQRGIGSEGSDPGAAPRKR